MSDRRDPRMSSPKPLVIDATTHYEHMHYKQPLESDMLGQWDLRDRVTGRLLEPTVVIERIRLFVPPVQRKRKLADGRYVPEKLNKYELEFVGKRKHLVAGPTIQSAIASMYGKSPQAWIGKKITLYVDEDVMMGRKKTGGIRVRAAAPTEEPTEEPLDNAVDERLRALQDEAFRGDGEEGGT